MNTKFMLPDKPEEPKNPMNPSDAYNPRPSVPEKPISQVFNEEVITPTAGDSAGSLERVASYYEESDNTAATKRGYRKRAVIIIALALLLTLAMFGGLQFAQRQNLIPAPNASLIPSQNAEISGALPAISTLELQDGTSTIVVNGDIFSKGDIRFYVTDQNYFTFTSNDLTSNTVYNLPGTSGTICLDTNNCNFAYQDQLNQLVGQIDGLTVDVPPASNSFATINAPAGSDPTADSPTDTLNFTVSGSNLTITGDSGSDSLSFDLGEVALAGAGIAVNGDALDVVSSNGAIAVNANDIALTLTTSGGAGATSSNSGLEILAGGLTLLKGCADSEILKYTDGGGWACALDNAGGGGANSFETINVPGVGDPVADSATDTLNLTVTGTNLTLTGNSGTDTIDFDVVETVLAGNGLVVTGDALDVSPGNGIQLTGDAVALGALPGDWSQTGAFDIILNNASSELQLLESVGGAFYATLDAGDLSADATYTFSGTTGTILTTANYTTTLDPVYVNTAESPAAGDIGGSFSGGLTIGPDSVALGTDTTRDYVASFTAGTGLSGDASGEGSTPTLSVNTSSGVTTSGDNVVVDQAFNFIFTGNVAFSPSSTNALDINLDSDSLLTIDQAFSGTASVNSTTLTVSNASTSGTQYGLYLDNAANTGSTEALLLIDNSDADTAVAAAIQIIAAAGGFTNLLDTPSLDISGSGAVSGATGLASSGTITFSGVTANRLVSTDGSSNLSTSLSSANAALSISDETGSGLLVFDTSPNLIGVPVIGDGAGNDYLEWTEEASNPTCGAGLYAVWANSSDGRLKKCQNGTITDLDTTGGSINSFETINIPGSEDSVAESSTDTLNITATGTNLDITGTASSDTIDFDLDEAALAGNGLAVNGDALDISLSGSTLEIVSDQLRVNEDANFAWLGGHTFSPSSTNALDINLDSDSLLTIDQAFSGTSSVNSTTLTVSNASTSGTQYGLYLDNAANTGSTEALLLIDNSDADTAVAAAIQIIAAAGGFTNLLDTPSLDISGSGAVSGATGIASSGTITFSGVTANRLVSTDGSSSLSTSLSSANAALSISDETGSGLLVFGTSPNLIGVPVIGDGAGNDYLEWTEEASNPTCGAGMYALWANSSDGRLKKCQNGTITDLDTTGGSINSFETINIPGSEDSVAESSTDTLNITATGTNLDITGTASTDTIDFDLDEAALAGNGLAVNGDALDISLSGSTLEIVSDQLRVNEDANFAWLGGHTFSPSSTNALDINLDSDSLLTIDQAFSGTSSVNSTTLTVSNASTSEIGRA